ncbi:MAG: hypothetical protein D6790_13975, partial [Caldilineae bacterium]
MDEPLPLRVMVAWLQSSWPFAEATATGGVVLEPMVTDVEAMHPWASVTVTWYVPGGMAAT